MGILLTTPCTSCEVTSGESPSTRVSYAVCEMQGWRRNMEDAHIAVANLSEFINNHHIQHNRDLPRESSDVSNDDINKLYPVPSGNLSLFGVFDGHGGKEVAKFTAHMIADALIHLDEFQKGNIKAALTRVFHLMDELLEDEQYNDLLKHYRSLPNPSDSFNDDFVDKSYQNNQKRTLIKNLLSKLKIAKHSIKQKSVSTKDNTDLNIENASNIDLLNESLESLAIDSEIKTDKLTYTMNGDFASCNLHPHRVLAGCTAIVLLKHDKTLYIANAGDSRALLCRSDYLVEALSIDHKPYLDFEFDRIVAAGGFVTKEGRVNGNLNLSRSIGDLKYKQNPNIPKYAQLISAEPDIKVVNIDDTETDAFVLIACDGIFDVMSNEVACNFVRSRLCKGMEPSEIVKEMCNSCVAPDSYRGLGTDNMTCIIVLLNR